jgi:hypothetical protein
MPRAAASKRHHAIERQLCRLLPLNLERSADLELKLTQESMENMIGLRREAASAAAIKLQNAGMICYGLKHIAAIDRPALDQRRFECNVVLKPECERFGPRTTR